MAAPASLVQQRTSGVRFFLLKSLGFFIKKEPNIKAETGEYDKFFEEGSFSCVGCETPLYKSTTKFDSGCGWPAFFEGLPGAINRTPDPDGRRTEITCTIYGGHLGHVCKGEGYDNPTDEHHCVNSVSINFNPAKSSSVI